MININVSLPGTIVGNFYHIRSLFIALQVKRLT